MVLHENGKNSAYFVDSLGFIELSGFMRKLEGVRDTFGHDVQKTEPEDIEDGDEIIDLGDETEQVLAEMKKSLEGSQDTSGHDAQNPEQAAAEEVEETEIAFQIADRYISIQETEGGYDYSIMDADYLKRKH